MASITYTVKESGGDYTTLSAAVAAMTDGNDYTVECDAFVCEDNVTMPEGFSSFSCLIKAATGHEHNGVPGAGFVLISDAAATFLASNCDNVTVQDIEIVNTNQEAVHYALRNSGTSSPNNVFQRLILRHTGGDHITQKCAHITTKVARIDNILCIGGEQGIFLRDGNVIRNCTAVGHIRGFNTDHSDCISINCVAYPVANASYDGPLSVEGWGADGGGTWLTASCSNNASNDATAPGANAQDNISIDDFAGYAAGNYRPAVSGALAGTGTDLSGSFTDDVAGDTRSTWDIGAFIVNATGGYWTLTNLTDTHLTRNSQMVSKLTADAGNATAIGHANTLASDTHASQWQIERKTGTGDIEITMDGGSTWTDITSSVGAAGSGPGECIIEQTLADPQIGIRIVTSGDEVFVYNAALVPNCTAAELVGVTVPVNGESVTKAYVQTPVEQTGSWSGETWTKVFPGYR